jgi:hypothetical protein
LDDSVTTYQNVSPSSSMPACTANEAVSAWVSSTAARNSSLRPSSSAEAFDAGAAATDATATTAAQSANRRDVLRNEIDMGSPWVVPDRSPG